jgi:hypothetical protein
MKLFVKISIEEKDGFYKSFATDFLERKVFEGTKKDTFEKAVKECVEYLSNVKSVSNGS